MRFFVDCDVLLDVALAREPFCGASGAVLDYLASHPGNGFIAWHSIANFYYITAKANDKQQSKLFIRELCQFVSIAVTSNTELITALDLPFSDFEDAMQCAAALSCAANLIISRNISDYRLAPVRTITPEQFLQELSLYSQTPYKT